MVSCTPQEKRGRAGRPEMAKPARRPARPQKHGQNARIKKSKSTHCNAMVFIIHTSSFFIPFSAVFAPPVASACVLINNLLPSTILDYVMVILGVV
jgi:hypothetical protein